MTNYELLQNCEKMLNAKTVYMWGCFGQKLTPSLVAAKATQYPSNYSTARQEYLLTLGDEIYACDCAGLIKNAMWGGFGNKLTYDSATDLGSEGLFRTAKEKGKIADLPETVGLVVYKKGHVGVYAGNGFVIECTLGSRGDGVVKTPIKSAGWTDWLYVPQIEYIKPATKPINTSARYIQFKNKVLNSVLIRKMKGILK